MSAMRTVGKIISTIEDWLTIICFVAMTVVVVVIVLFRYVLHIPFIQGEEIARYLMIWCAYAGTAYGFRTHSHVGVVVFADMMPKATHPAIKAIRDILSTVVVIGLFIFACMCLSKFIGSGQITTATRIPMAAVFIIIPISMIFSIIHNIVDIVKDFSPDKDNPKEVAR